MLSTEVEYSINKLFRDARDKHHEFVTVEHLLLSMTTNPSAGKALRACGVDISILQTELESYIEESTPLLTEEDKRETQPTLGFQRVIQRAVYHVQATGKGEVSGENILVAIFGEPESHAVYYLGKQDMSRLDLVNYVSHDIRKDEAMLSDFSLEDPETNDEQVDVNIENDPDKGLNSHQGFFKPTDHEKDGREDLELDKDEEYINERKKKSKHWKDGVQMYSTREHTMKYVNFTWVDKEAILCKHCKNKIYLKEHIYRNTSSSVFIKAKYANYLMLNVENHKSNNFVFRFGQIYNFSHLDFGLVKCCTTLTRLCNVLMFYNRS